MRSLFVDECKQQPYLFVGFAISAVKQQSHRRNLRSLLLPGQRSLHFKSEDMRRKKAILKQMLDLDCRVVVVKCRSTPKGTARLCALQSLLTSDLASSCKRIVLELDETVRLKDHGYLKRQHWIAEWDHRQRHEEPLLWVADAVAWCVNRGGEWERMVRPMIVETIEC